MSRSVKGPGTKRKRPDSDPSGLNDAERKVLNAIKSRGDSGIWLRDIRAETELLDPLMQKSLKSLTSKNLIKEVVNVKNKGKKHYMAAEFEPCTELTGGDWYSNGELDEPFINSIKMLSLQYIRKGKVATAEGIRNWLNRSGALPNDLTSRQTSEILNCMILDNDIVEARSTGSGDYRSIPVGAVCYSVAKAARAGAFASIPCGACPRISMCAPDGIISPSTCVYYKKWLGLDF